MDFISLNNALVNSEDYVEYPITRLSNKPNYIRKDMRKQHEAICTKLNTGLLLKRFVNDYGVSTDYFKELTVKVLNYGVNANYAIVIMDSLLLNKESIDLDEKGNIELVINTYVECFPNFVMRLLEMTNMKQDDTERERDSKLYINKFTSNLAMSTNKNKTVFVEGADYNVGIGEDFFDQYKTADDVEEVEENLTLGDEETLEETTIEEEFTFEDELENEEDLSTQEDSTPLTEEHHEDLDLEDDVLEEEVLEEEILEENFENENEYISSIDEDSAIIDLEEDTLDIQSEDNIEQDLYEDEILVEESEPVMSAEELQQSIENELEFMDELDDMPSLDELLGVDLTEETQEGEISLEEDVISLEEDEIVVEDVGEFEDVEELEELEIEVVDETNEVEVEDTVTPVIVDVTAEIIEEDIQQETSSNINEQTSQSDGDNNDGSEEQEVDTVITTGETEVMKRVTNLEENGVQVGNDEMEMLLEDKNDVEETNTLEETELVLTEETMQDEELEGAEVDFEMEDISKPTEDALEGVEQVLGAEEVEKEEPKETIEDIIASAEKEINNAMVQGDGMTDNPYSQDIFGAVGINDILGEAQDDMVEVDLTEPTRLEEVKEMPVVEIEQPVMEVVQEPITAEIEVDELEEMQEEVKKEPVVEETPQSVVEEQQSSQEFPTITKLENNNLVDVNSEVALTTSQETTSEPLSNVPTVKGEDKVFTALRFFKFDSEKQREELKQQGINETTIDLIVTTVLSEIQKIELQSINEFVSLNEKVENLENLVTALQRRTDSHHIVRQETPKREIYKSNADFQKAITYNKIESRGSSDGLFGEENITVDMSDGLVINPGDLYPTYRKNISEDDIRINESAKHIALLKEKNRL